MEVEEEYMAMADRHRGQGGDICYVHMAMSWRREMREAGRRKSFLFYLFLIESHQFVLLI